ncbi:Hypothetical protein PBC10988_9340 [Planctomycetales bacterium 10988]|nr:Hypothetical protein PBC10988_9340 [Planctomycetales bacterium 10988]
MLKQWTLRTLTTALALSAVWVLPNTVEAGNPASSRRAPQHRQAPSTPSAPKMQQTSQPVSHSTAMPAPGVVHSHSVPAGECTDCAPGAAPQRYYPDLCPGEKPTLWQRLKFKWENYWKPGLQESHWGYPEEFCEKPLGYYVHANFKTMVANGEAVRMTLYEYDFELDSRELSPRGLRQLEKIAYMSVRNFFPIVIQRDYRSPELNEARRQFVIATLARNGVPVPPERVLVSHELTPGMSSDEALLVDQNILTDVQTRGYSLRGFRGGGVEASTEQ